MATKSKPALHLSLNDEADALLSKEPLALLIGMVLDQQIPLEWAFHGPFELTKRLGRRLDAADLAAMDTDELVAVFSQRPALHRFPGSMAKRVQDLCRHLVDAHRGKPDAVWKSATTGDELLANVRELPGFGDQKARIFVALLGKQLGVQPPGWAESAGEYADPGTYMSVADIDGPASLEKVRAYKKAKKAAAKQQPAP